MAGPIANTPPIEAQSDPGFDYRPALTLLATLFFMWGFITVINNTLLPHLKSVFDLNYTQTTLIESTWFIGYLVASIPAAKLIERIGYHKALVVGLAIMTVGSLGMIPAARLPSPASLPASSGRPPADNLMVRFLVCRSHNAVTAGSPEPPEIQPNVQLSVNNPKKVITVQTRGAGRSALIA